MSNERYKAGLQSTSFSFPATQKEGDYQEEHDFERAKSRSPQTIAMALNPLTKPVTKQEETSNQEAIDSQAEPIPSKLIEDAIRNNKLEQAKSMVIEANPLTIALLLIQIAETAITLNEKQDTTDIKKSFARKILPLLIAAELDYNMDGEMPPRENPNEYTKILFDNETLGSTTRRILNEIIDKNEVDGEPREEAAKRSYNELIQNSQAILSSAPSSSSSSQEPSLLDEMKDEIISGIDSLIPERKLSYSTSSSESLDVVDGKTSESTSPVQSRSGSPASEADVANDVVLTTPSPSNGSHVEAEVKSKHSVASSSESLDEEAEKNSENTSPTQSRSSSPDSKAAAVANGFHLGVSPEPKGSPSRSSDVSSSEIAGERLNANDIVIRHDDEQEKSRSSSSSSDRPLELEVADDDRTHLFSQAAVPSSSRDDAERQSEQSLRKERSLLNVLTFGTFGRSSKKSKNGKSKELARVTSFYNFEPTIHETDESNIERYSSSSSSVSKIPTSHEEGRSRSFSITKIFGGSHSSRSVSPRPKQPEEPTSSIESSSSTKLSTSKSKKRRDKLPLPDAGNIIPVNPPAHLEVPIESPRGKKKRSDRFRPKSSKRQSITDGQSEEKRRTR